MSIFKPVTQMERAIYTGNSYLLQQLIDEGVDVNVPNAQGATALHGAASFRDEHMTGLLLKAGADKTIKDKLERTAYDVASAFGGSEELLKMLSTGDK